MNSCDLVDLEIVDAVLDYKLVVAVEIVDAADVGPASADKDMQKDVVVDYFDVIQQVESEMSRWQEHLLFDVAELDDIVVVGNFH